VASIGAFTHNMLNHHRRYTDKKENLIFLIYKEIQSRAVAMSYMSIEEGLATKIS
jgi:hypothetical protein